MRQRMAGGDKSEFVESGARQVGGPEGGESPKLTKPERAVNSVVRESATAMELPFTIVGAIVLAGFLGYLVDRWLHTWPWVTIVGGGLGFAGSLIDIARRYRPR